MRLGLCVLALVIVSIPVSTHADEFGITAQGVEFALDTSPTGIITVLGNVEEYSTSFIYDSLTHSVSDMLFTAQGAVNGSLDFIGLTDNGTATGFTWSNADAAASLSVLDDNFARASAGLPIIEGTKSFSFGCLSNKCSDTFTLPDPDPQGTELHNFISFYSVSPVPEPSSLSLLAFGVLGCGFFTRIKLMKRSRSKGKRHPEAIVDGSEQF